MWYFAVDGMFLQAGCQSPCVLYSTNSFSWACLNSYCNYLNWLCVKYKTPSIFLNYTLYYSMKIYCFMMIDSYVFLVLVKLGWNVITFYRCKVLCDRIFLLHKGQIMVICVQMYTSITFLLDMCTLLDPALLWGSIISCVGLRISFALFTSCYHNQDQCNNANKGSIFGDGCSMCGLVPGLVQ